MPRSLFKRFISLIRHFAQSVRAQYGPLFPGILSFTYYSLLRRNRFIVLLHGPDSHCLQPLPIRDLVIHTTTGQSLDRIRGNRLLPREFYCDKTYGVSEYYLGTIADEPAYIHWIFRCCHQSRFLKMKSGDAEVNYMLALPTYGGRGLCSYVLSRTVADLKAGGVKRIFCVVHDHNTASIKATWRAGFRPYGQVTAIGPFNSKLKV